MSDAMLSSLKSSAANGAGTHSLAFLNPLLRHNVIYGARGYQKSDKRKATNDNRGNGYKTSKTEAIGRIDGVGGQSKPAMGPRSNCRKDDSGIQDWLSRACGGVLMEHKEEGLVGRLIRLARNDNGPSLRLVIRMTCMMIRRHVWPGLARASGLAV
jgi:hypothetical protein